MVYKMSLLFSDNMYNYTAVFYITTNIIMDYALRIYNLLRLTFIAFL